mgnify:FL=1
MTKEECREQIQEDISAYLESRLDEDTFSLVDGTVCQIVVDNFKKLED